MGFIHAKKYHEAINMSYQLLVDYVELDDIDCFHIAATIANIKTDAGKNLEKEDVFNILILLTRIFDSGKKYKNTALQITDKRLVPKFLTTIEQIDSNKCAAYLRKLFNLKKYKQMLKVLNQMKNGENVS